MAPDQILEHKWGPSLPRSRFLDVTQRFPKKRLRGRLVGAQNKDFRVVSAMAQATQARIEMFSSTPLLYPNFPQVLPQPRSQGSLLPVGRVGENPGNEVGASLGLLIKSVLHP